MNKNKALPECARIERNRYQREWRSRNKDRVREINARYWVKRSAANNSESKEEVNHEEHH